ncbi:MAG: GNAT family N-acetyltransferase [Bdellovibrionales bacterium]
MNLQSLGYRTDLMIHEFENRVEDKSHYIVVETPSNPHFFWGNFLIFKEPPRAHDLVDWPKLFSREFAHQPLIKHCTLAWDSVTAEKGCAQAFVEAGFSLEEAVVLTVQTVCPPPKINRALEIRPLSTDADWKAAITNQVKCCPQSFKAELYEPFKRKQMVRYRRMCEASLGYWYGAFLDGRLVGDLGIFVRDGIARYQSVGTHPDFRRQGVCGTLVWKSALHVQENKYVQTLVMVADEKYHAARIYESVGFRPTERQIGVFRWPQEEWLL